MKSFVIYVNYSIVNRATLWSTSQINELNTNLNNVSANLTNGNADSVAGVPIVNTDPGTATTYYLGSNGGNNPVNWIHQCNMAVNYANSAGTANFVNGIKIAAGSKVLNVNSTSTSAQMLTTDELNALFGVSNSSNLNTICFFANGDGGVQSVHIDGATYKDARWYAVFSTTAAAGNIRINYFAAYFG